MRYFIATLLILRCFATFAQVGHNLPALRYDSAVIYSYSPQRDNPDIIDKNGKLNQSVNQSALLDSVTAREINNKLETSGSFNDSMGLCFDPHLAFVYYRSGKPIADIVVCLACNVFICSVNDIPKWYFAGGMTGCFQKYLRDLGVKYHLAEIQAPIKPTKKIK
ncbi:hypothetical protein CJD36_010290 [Flavipsychrobacter stenotrophus]|uniref:Uncharacterized protein n=1 Tax=Flavipsychrobacter stenotrophus TaxID=2077091 RepID=A0A2S7SUQ4_9BACT|nr:hypothetical protein [Flavipsychrobacter stenotrophus]PQJ10357.1 hypothetical protein CJD36_010290 [Flavipsychrobacter stenotrophus]